MATLSLGEHTMSLDLVLGPMWAGKSSYIIGKIRRYRAIGWDVFVIANPLDNRYGSQIISSHDKEQVAAIAISDLTTVYNEIQYKEARLLIIEEAQFYTGLYDFVKTAVERDKKHVVCVNAGIHDFLTHGSFVGNLWLQRCVYRRQPVLWWLR